jgi:hypothetical protein
MMANLVRSSAAARQPARIQEALESPGIAFISADDEGGPGVRLFESVAIKRCGE